MKKVFVALALALSLASSVFAAPLEMHTNKTLDAKALPKTWVTGQPITEWKANDLYVLEFWATWCGPCIKAMPHMEELWQAVKGQGIHFLGVNVNREPNFGAQAIRDFIAQRNLKVTYDMAFDEGGRLADSLKIMGIPNAIVVKDGVILWRGHPGSLTVDILKTLAQTSAADCKSCEAAKDKGIAPPPVPQRKKLKIIRNQDTDAIGTKVAASALPAAEHWAQGTPVTEWKPGELYLLEFWASWCGPCRAAIPHLEELHRASMNNGLTVIGVNLDRGYDVQQIRNFMERQPVHPTYALVYGTESAVTQQLKPRAIPHAVLIRDGVIVWAGHPEDLTTDQIMSYRKK